jgi:serine/threonine protein kinase, bacterial
VLPFTGVKGPVAVSVTGDKTVYALGGDGRVLKLPAGATAATELPFPKLEKPWGPAVDGQGTVYVTDTGRNRTLMLPAD